MNGVLRPRPFVNVDAPLSLDEVLNPMRLCQTNYPHQQEPLNLSVLRCSELELDSGIVSDPTICSQAASNTETSSFDEISDVVDQPAPDDPEIPEVGAETTVNQNDSDHSSPETITTLPTPTPPRGPSLTLCHAVEDARNKHCRVNLVMLTNAKLEKHLNMKPDNDIKMDNKKKVCAANESITRRRAPVNYAESIISDGGSILGDTTDIDQEEYEKPK